VADIRPRVLIIITYRQKRPKTLILFLPKVILKLTDIDNTTQECVMRHNVISNKKTEDILLNKFTVWSRLLKEGQLERSEIPFTEWELEFLSTIDPRLQPSFKQRKIMHEIAIRLYFVHKEKK
jgi:hypothetical protein